MVSDCYALQPLRIISLLPKEICFLFVWKYLMSN